jgi:hypothetical protein
MILSLGKKIFVLKIQMFILRIFPDVQKWIWCVPTNGEVSYPYYAKPILAWSRVSKEN